MNIDFRQGVIAFRGEKPLILRSGRYIDLRPDPTIDISFAHGDKEYLFKETLRIDNAWTINPSDHLTWLYWDVDIFTGNLSRGTTTIQPRHGSNFPLSPVKGQHFFNTDFMSQYVWNGVQWLNVLRVFAARVRNGAIDLYGEGTQVNVNRSFDTFPLSYDLNGRPLTIVGSNGAIFFDRVSDSRLKKTQGLTNVSLEQNKLYGVLAADMEKHTPVTLDDNSDLIEVDIADYTKPCVGVTLIKGVEGDIVPVIRNGDIEKGGFALPTGSNGKVFLGTDGGISTVPPSSGFVQELGYILNARLLHIDVKPPILLDPDDETLKVLEEIE